MSLSTFASVHSVARTILNESKSTEIVGLIMSDWLKIIR